MNIKRLLIIILFLIILFGSLSFAEEKKLHIGIFYFVPQGEDVPWIRKGITILLINRFTQFSQFKVLPRDRLEEVDYTVFTANRVGDLAGKFSLDYVIGGTYSLNEDTINVTAWAWSKAQERFLVSFTASGGLLDIVKKIAVSAYDAIAGSTYEETSRILRTLPTKSEDACRYLFTAVDYMDQAIKAYNGADFPSKPLWKKAIENGEKAVQIDPGFSLAYYYLGLIYSKTKWVKREADAWENYLKYTKEKEFPEETGGLAYYRLGYSFYEKGEYDLAQRYLEKAILIDPTLVKPYVYLGNIYYDQDNLDEAIKYYKKAYTLSPSDKDIEWLLKRAERIKEVGKEAYDYFEKGHAAFSKGDYVEAAYYLEHAVGINPSYLEAFVLLGKTYMELDEFEKAEESLQRAGELEPTNYEIKLLLDKVRNERKYGKEAYEAFSKGYDLYKEGHSQEALYYFEEAVRKNPNFDIAHDYLARVYYQIGELDKYKEEREKVASITQDPKEKANIYYSIGYEFFSLKKYDIAKEEFEKALNANPEHTKAAFFLAEVYYNLKDYRNAITYYTKVLKNAQGKDYYDKALYGRGWSYFFLKDYKKEIADFLRIVKDFKYSSLRNVAQYKLGEAYYLIGDYIDAIKWLKDFVNIKSSPYRKDAFYIVIISYIKSKNLKDAKAYLDKASALYPEDKKFLSLKDLLRDYAFDNREYELLLEELKGRKDELSLYEKVVALWELGRKDEAEFQFSVFKERYPDSKYLRDLTILFLSDYIKGDKRKAIELITYAIDKNIEIFPSIYKTYFVRGKLYFDLKQYKNAMGDFEKAIRGKFEDLSEAYYLLGLSYDYSGEKERALSIFKELGEKFKDKYSCLGNYYVGGYYYREKKWDDALTYYKKITLTCKKIDYLDKVHFYLGMIHYNKGNFGGAIWNFKRSISLTKDRALRIENYYFIGKSYINSGKESLGKPWLQKVIKEGKNTEYYKLAQALLNTLEEAPYKKAESLISEGKFKDALSVLSTVEGKGEKKIYLEAKAYMGLKNWQKAESLFLELLNAHTSRYEEVVYGLSYVYFKEKKYFLVIELADEYLERGKFGELGDDILYISALSYEMLGKKDQAKARYEKILKFFPDTPLKDKIEKRMEVMK